MQQLIKQREIIQNNWQHVGLDEPLPEKNIIVPLSRWLTESDSLKKHKGHLGILIKSDEEFTDILADLDFFEVIAIDFPTFKDGRGYSTGKLLRERHQYKGELRAVGNILRDQLFFLERCGFDAYELEEGKDINDALKSFNDFSIKYQPSADGPATLE